MKVLNIDIHMYTIIFQTAWYFASASRLNFHTTISKQILIQEMNLIIFRLIEVLTKLGQKTASMHSVLLQKFFVLFSVDTCTSINRKNEIYFISFNFHFISESTKKSIILILLITGLFPTFDVVEIQYMTSRYCFLVDAKITNFLTNQNVKGYAITLMNIKWLDHQYQ